MTGLITNKWQSLALYKKAKDGDIEAINKIAIYNSGLIHKVISTLTVPNGIDRSDLASEGHLILLKAARGYDHTKTYTFSTYAYSCLRNGLIKLINDNRPEIHMKVETMQLNETIDIQDDSQDMFNDINNMDLYKALSKLDNKELLSIIMYFGFKAQPLTLSEIASVMNISVASAGRLVSRSINRLQDILCVRNESI